MGRSDSLSFTFKGTSSTTMGVHVLALPDIPVAEERGQEVTIPGRDGTLWLSEGAYADIELPFLIEYGSTADLNAIAGWLSGYGELVISTQPNYCYHARITSGFALQHGIYAFGHYRAEINFVANPYKYVSGNPALPDMTQSTMFDGNGSIYSRPVITIYANGDVNLLVNDCSVLIEDIDEYVTIDCEAMMAFKDDTNWGSKVRLLSNGEVDEWPSLRPYGYTNYIDWYDDDGSQSQTHVTKVVVRPNWRWR